MLVGANQVMNKDYAFRSQCLVILANLLVALSRTSLGIKLLSLDTQYSRGPPPLFLSSSNGRFLSICCALNTCARL